jgi:ergothioneine biosynthesis protein EgtB
MLLFDTPNSFDRSMSLSLTARLKEARAHTLTLAQPLSSEDMQLQAEDFASPSKWHLAHTTWFFEEFILKPLGMKSGMQEAYRFLFNSYYETVGERQPQGKRGIISRPGVAEILAYRHEVDALLWQAMASGLDDQLMALAELGLHHEQQHQELFITDILFNLYQNPLHPRYLEKHDAEWDIAACDVAPGMVDFDGGLVEIGASDTTFCFDNEQPRHQVFIAPFRMAKRLVTNAEWIAFIEDGGYEDPLLWLSDGWKIRTAEGWQMPLYWQDQAGYEAYGLTGMKALEPNAPVTNISYFEADAYARWSGKRLPTEFEWEIAAISERSDSPQGQTTEPALSQFFGRAWQWTSSPYIAYPGFKTSPGAVGEYNGKFMNGQYVLRGSSFATPKGHARVSYRNFFYPHQRWQFTGLRLAE